VRGILSISERRACAALGQHRSTQRKIPRGREDEARLTTDMVELVRQYGRYGYRKIAELLRQAGWLVNDKRVERIWRRDLPPEKWTPGYAAFASACSGVM
jgi:transposase InsO family protein